MAAAEVAERAGSIALQTRQRMAGVVENMSWMELPDGSRLEVFGSGGGQTVADSLSRSWARRCRCSARSRSRPGCASAATRAPRSCWPSRAAPSAVALQAISDTLTTRARGLAGMSLNISPVRR